MRGFHSNPRPVKEGHGSLALSRRSGLWLAVCCVTLCGGIALAMSSMRPRRTTGSRRSASMLVWSDDFRGPSNRLPRPDYWEVDVGAGWGNGELQSYSARTKNVSLNGRGDLVLTARRASVVGARGRPAYRYTSGRVDTEGRVAFSRGFVEARIKVPSGQGLWPAFWLHSTGSNQRWDGELDAMEMIGKYPRTVFATAHYPTFRFETRTSRVTATPISYRGAAGSVTLPRPLSDRFHVYGMRWNSESVTFWMDGDLYYTVERASLRPGQTWVFDHPFYIVLDLAVGGGWPGPPTSSTRFPARMVVDWIRFYS